MFTLNYSTNAFIEFPENVVVKYLIRTLLFSRGAHQLCHHACSLSCRLHFLNMIISNYLIPTSSYNICIIKFCFHTVIKDI